MPADGLIAYGEENTTTASQPAAALDLAEETRASAKSLVGSPEPARPAEHKSSPPFTLGALQDALAERLAAALKMNPEELDLDETFYDLGVESVSAVEWIRTLSYEYAIPMTVSTLYDWPTLRRFADFLYSKLEERTLRQTG